MNEQIIFPKITSTGKTKTMNVKTRNVKQARAIKVTVTYDPAITKPKKVYMQKGIKGFIAFGNQIPGFLIISWFNYPAIDLKNNNVFFKITWTKVSKGSSKVGVLEGLGSFGCRMFCNNVEVGDSPTENYYKEGEVTFS